MSNASVRGHPCLHFFSHDLYWKLKAGASGNSGSLECKCISPEENAWKDPLWVLNILCTDTLPLVFHLKALCMEEGLMAVPHPGRVVNPDTQANRVLSCPFKSSGLSCSFVETKQRWRNFGLECQSEVIWKWWRLPRAMRGCLRCVRSLGSWLRLPGDMQNLRWTEVCFSGRSFPEG